jgi:signal peptidase I
MMTDVEGAQLKRRPVWARVGITLLNLLQPGLGLIRLGRYRAGLLFLALNVAFLAAYATLAAVDVLVTFERFVAGVIFLFLFALALCGTAFVLNWRSSGALASRAGWLWRWYGVLGTWLLVVVLSWPFTGDTNWGLRSFYAASRSMAPTLERGDRFIAKMRNIDPIARGDVVIMRVGEAEWVKRVVALPGDTISIRDGIIVLNDVPVAQRFLGKVHLEQEDPIATVIHLSEQLPAEIKSHEIYDMGVTNLDNISPIKLEQDQYFLLGDSRDNSIDSRSDTTAGGLGLVQRSRIEGRVLFRYWRTGLGLAKGEV